MNAIIALCFIFVVYAIGDVISVKTKSIVSSLFTCSVLFLIGFWVGVPADLFQQANLFQIGAVIIPVLLVHMGSMIDLEQIKAQWKTLIIALSAVIGVAVTVLAVGQFFVDREAAIIAAPPIAGGIIAGIQMGEAANNIGREDLAVLATLLVVIQGFVGYPIASICLKKEGRRVLESYRSMGAEVQKAHTEVKVERKKLIKPLSEKYVGSNLLIAKAMIIGVLAVVISTKIHEAVGFNLIDKNVLALLLGILFYAIGFLDSSVLIKANAFGFMIAALMAVIFANLSTATPEMIGSLLPVIVTTLALGTVGILVFSFIVGKLLKVSKYMAAAIGISALFGFPGTYIISQEVSNALGENEEERKVVLDSMLPQMLVAGFVTVSIASVILAGIMAPML